MGVKLPRLWDRLRSSFWFLPSLMTCGAMALAFAGLAIDSALGRDWLRGLGFVYAGGADGASAVLQAIAGSMVTLAGLVFSLTLVALTLAAQQYGSRVLRSFMRDRRNQVVLGTFISTFLYCLLVLLNIRHEDDLAVPHLSVTLGVVLAVASLAVLIYFVHHVALSIQADTLVASVGGDLIGCIDRLCPERAPAHAVAHVPERDASDACPIPGAADGYLQMVDLEGLLALARERDLLIETRLRPGQYAVAGTELVRAWPAARIDEDTRAGIVAAFAFGSQRTPEQDVEYGFEQLVQIAVRALSPGINDPFTALACIDRLGSALCRMAAREMPPSRHADADGRPRLVLPPLEFAAVVDTAFDQVRRYGQGSAAVMLRLLEAIVPIAAFVRRDGDRAALGRQARMIARGAPDAVPEAEDRAAVEAAFARALGALRGR